MSAKLFARAAMLLAALTIASASHAATICVSDTAASCEATIADAIAAADAGDTISLRTGVYFENVTVPAALDGLRITGPSTAILDPGDDGVAAVPNTGDGITINANDVTVQGITIRNGEDDHIVLGLNVTGTTVSGVRSINADDDFVSSDATGNDDTTVRGCAVHAPDGGALDVDGDGVTVSGNHIANTSSDAVEIDGDDALVERNVLIAVENGDAVNIDGDNAEVVNNRISATDDDGQAFSQRLQRVQASRASSSCAPKAAPAPSRSSAVRASGVRAAPNRCSGEVMACRSLPKGIQAIRRREQTA